MPIYEYECEKCKRVFEELIFGSESGVSCPDCESDKVVRLISATSSVVGEKGGIGAPAAGCGTGGFS